MVFINRLSCSSFHRGFSIYPGGAVDNLYTTTFVDSSHFCSREELVSCLLVQIMNSMYTTLLLFCSVGAIYADIIGDSYGLIKPVESRKPEGFSLDFHLIVYSTE